MFSEEYTYTKGEKIGEAVSTVLAVGFDGAYIVLMIAGQLSWFWMILFIVMSAIVYGAFTVGSKAPQFTANVLVHKDLPKGKIRLIRRASITVKIALMSAIFAFAMVGVLSVRKVTIICI